MKTKLMAAAAAALCVTACTSAVLWTSNITDSYVISSPLTVASDDAGNSYQLYTGIGALTHLRKLDPKGNELWQQEVGWTSSSVFPLKLLTTPVGVAVGYSELKDVLILPDTPVPSIDNMVVLGSAHLVQFDTDGTELWRTDFGAHKSDILTDMILDDNGNLVAVLHLRGDDLQDPLNNKFSVQRFDATGIALAQHEGMLLPDYCRPLCSSDVAIHPQGDVLFNFAGPSYTLFVRLTPDGTFPWRTAIFYPFVLPGKYTSNIDGHPNHVVATPSGFVTSNGNSTWEYDLAGNTVWTQPFGSSIAIATDTAGNLYIPNGTTISKLASDGTRISDIALDGQVSIKQIEWREDLQRMIVLSEYATTGPVVNGTITEESGQTLFVFDAAGVKKASYKSNYLRVTKPVCEPDTTACGEPTSVGGERWQYFTTTTDRKIVVSGNKAQDEEITAFAKAYRLP